MAKTNFAVESVSAPNFAQIEKKWQSEWEKEKAFQLKDDSKKKKCYVLEMFPYPSGSGLHMGHAFNYTIGDIFSRYKRMNGFNVLYPMGYDAFGLPAENAAIKAGKHPREHTENAIKNFIKQQKELGLSYDWSKLVVTCYPDYYKWNQFFFLKFLENDLAYRKKAAVNWCPKCETVLANEQVHSGKCWRHEDTDVEIKQLEQWFVKTTKYSEELLANLPKLDWPARIKAMQENWIGKSYGTEINFEVINPDNDFSKKEFVFLHAYGDTSKGSFWQWLKGEVEARGAKVVFSKDLPSTNKPVVENQADFVLKNCEFNENTVIVTHSLGGPVALKLLTKLKTKISKLVLVAPPLRLEFLDKKRRPNLDDACDWKFDFDLVKKNVGEIVVLADENDYIVPPSHPREIAERLSAKLVVLKASMSHFNSSKEPEVLNQLSSVWPIFTTRPDTIFGVTFMVVSAQHPRLNELVTKAQKKEVNEFLKKVKSTSEKDAVELEKEGAFTGSYAINPVTNEKVPVWTGNFVVADYGAGMVMAVPAHDQRDYEFAVKYNIPIKQVIAPKFITDNGVDAIRPNAETIERKAVFGIVKHWKEDKYYCLDWPKFNWKTFIIGGVEDSESPKEAVVREVKEETGFQDIKSIKEVGWEVYSKFFATHKGVNRAAYQKTFLVELGSDKFVEPKAEHVKNHKGLWVAGKDVANFLNIKAQQFLWNEFQKGMSAFTSEGLLINSGEFNGIDSDKAIDEVTKYLESEKIGKATLNYKFRDWLISRQRYWGTPIPVVYCDKCGIVPVPEKDLPVKLPEKVVFGQGNPLLTSKEFVETKCPKCKAKARRETDTMDTFFDSSWYFLRYCDNKNDKIPFDKKKVKYWVPVDQYIGGAEHACMHLIYARFFTMALRDLGLVDIPGGEPFTKLFNQGMLHGTDGFVMSKSRGNVVLPEEVSKKYGIDTARLFLVSQSLPDKDAEWKEDGIEGTYKNVLKIINFFDKIKTNSSKSNSLKSASLKSTSPKPKSSRKIESKINKAIREVSKDIEEFRYNFAVIKLRALFDSMEGEEVVSREHLEIFLKLLHPFCPHFTEELWEKIGGKELISLSQWPKFDEKLIDENLERIEAVVDNLRLDIFKVKELAKLEKVSKVRIFVAPEWKWNALAIVKKACEQKPDFGSAMKALMSNVEMKKHGVEIQPFLKTAMNRLSDVSLLEKFDEVAVLKEVAPKLEKEFGAIEIIPAEKSSEVKAKNAFPGKPALLIE